MSALGALGPDALESASREAAARQLTDLPEGHPSRAAALVAAHLDTHPRSRRAALSAPATLLRAPRPSAPSTPCAICSAAPPASRREAPIRPAATRRIAAFTEGRRAARPEVTSGRGTYCRPAFISRTKASSSSLWMTAARRKRPPPGGGSHRGRAGSHAGFRSRGGGCRRSRPPPPATGGSKVTLERRARRGACSPLSTSAGHEREVQGVGEPEDIGDQRIVLRQRDAEDLGHRAGEDGGGLVRVLRPADIHDQHMAAMEDMRVGPEHRMQRGGPATALPEAR